jgi:hypothetical protein
LVGGAALLAAAVTAGACGGGKCELDTRMKALAGADAVFCGQVPVDGPRAEANACVETAFGGGRPFWVRYDQKGENATVAEAIVRSPEGKVYFVEYNSSPCGSPACDARLVAVPCMSPFLENNPLRPIACATRGEARSLCDD